MIPFFLLMSSEMGSLPAFHRADGVRGAVKLWKVDKRDFLACATAFLDVLLVFVQTGLIVAVGISLFKILL
jgi:hypothetical protein